MRARGNAPYEPLPRPKRIFVPHAHVRRFTSVNPAAASTKHYAQSASRQGPGNRGKRNIHECRQQQGDAKRERRRVSPHVSLPAWYVHPRGERALPSKRPLLVPRALLWPRRDAGGSPMCETSSALRETSCGTSNAPRPAELRELQCPRPAELRELQRAGPGRRLPWRARRHRTRPRDLRSTSSAFVCAVSLWYFSRLL